MTRGLIICFLSFSAILRSQSANFISVQKTGLQNYILSGSQYYDGNSLWGYMDGGADLYLEYGFDGVLVEQIVYKGLEIKAEIFRMKDPSGAFGIFSIQRHNCMQDTGFNAQHCINNYQVQVAKGNYYLSVINQSGDTNARLVTLEVAISLALIIEEEVIPVPAFLKNSFVYNPQSVIFLKGNTALGNVYPQGLSYLENTSGYTMWLLPALDKKHPSVSIINFENQDGLDMYMKQAFPDMEDNGFLQKKLKGNQKRLARKTGKTTILQLEGNIPGNYRKLFFGT